MTKITIITKGIGVFYQKDNMWKIIFPFDNNFQSDESCHQVKFTYRKAGEKDSEPISLANPNRTVSVVVNQPDPQSVSSVGNGIGEFIDLTADYAHSDGLNMKQDWQETSVMVTIPNAKFSVDTLTPDLFVLSV